jgi:uroporphyrinogen decarboxylase
LNSKERVKTALEHRKPDRLPVDYWATSEVTTRLISELKLDSEEELLLQLGSDCRYLNPEYVGPVYEPDSDGAWRDIWGVWRRQISYGGGSYDEVSCSPLAGVDSLAAIEDYQWPKAEWFDFSRMKKDARALSDFYLINAADRLNRTSVLKAAIYLRGMDTIMMDLAINPELATAMFEHIARFYLDCNRAMFEAAGQQLDMFFMGDDFGTQSGLLVSPRMWQDFFAPHLKSFCQQAHEYDLQVMLHSCGAVSEILSGLAECGVDVINPVQPGAAGMEPKSIKNRFGKDLSFHGAIDVQQTLPNGSPADVRAEVRARFEDLGRDGGYIVCPSHNFQPDVPTANILALYQEAAVCCY